MLFFLFFLSFCNDAKALWETNSAAAPQRKPTCYLSDLYPKSLFVEYQPKISLTWASH